MSGRTLGSVCLLAAMLATAPAGSEEILHRTTQNLPYLGRTLTLVKTWDAERGHIVRTAYENGRVVDEAALLAAEEAARYAAEGNVHPVLAERIAADPRARLQVLIRFAIDEELRDKSEITSEEEWQRHLEEAAAAHARLEATARALFDKKMARLGVTDAVTLEAVGPFLAAELRGETARSLGWDADVGLIALHGEEQIEYYPRIKESLPATYTNWLHFFGSKGMGTKIAMLEEDLLNLPTDCFNLGGVQQNAVGSMDTHPTRNVGMIGNRYNYQTQDCDAETWEGYAPDAEVYVANDPDYVKAYKWAKEKAVNAVTMSWGFTSEEGSGSLSARDVFFDFWGQQPPYPLIVQAASNGGDTGSYVVGRGYGTLSVGNVVNDGDLDQCNSVMHYTSSFKDPTSPNSDRDLPLIATNGSRHDLLGGDHGGTSAAAPATASIAVSLMSSASPLKKWPEAVRAILLAGAGYQGADGAAWQPGTDGKDGAGMTDAALAYLISQHKVQGSGALERGYDYGTLTPASFGAGGVLPNVWKIAVPENAQRVRVALVWNGRASWLFKVPILSQLDLDLDLVVLDPNGDKVASSSSMDASVEVLQFEPTQAGEYRIQVSGNHQYAQLKRHFALAWAKDWEACD
ncbi:MAG TPA: S8 family serine peptidase [Thermoanaerobaculia bacterium]|nr:S8 family serine peptidase [Thermoanaerobaculia bacterium]